MVQGLDHLGVLYLILIDGLDTEIINTLIIKITLPGGPRSPLCPFKPYIMQKSIGIICNQYNTVNLSYLFI